MFKISRIKRDQYFRSSKSDEKQLCLNLKLGNEIQE